MIPIEKINFGQFKIPGNIPDIPGFGPSIPGGPGAERRPPAQIGGIDMGIAGLIPAAKPQNIGDDPQRILTQPKANPNPYSNKGLTGPYAGVLEDFKNSQYYRGIHSMTGMMGVGGIQEFNPFGAERGLFGEGNQEAGFLQFLDQARAGGNVSQEYQDAYNVFNPLEGDARKFDNIYEQKEGQSRYSKVLTPEQKAEIARFEAMSPDERRAALTTTMAGAGGGALDKGDLGMYGPVPLKGTPTPLVDGGYALLPPQEYSGINIDAEGNITGQKGLGRITSQFGNMSDFDSFDPQLQSAIQFYQQGRPPFLGALDNTFSTDFGGNNATLMGPDGKPMQPFTGDTSEQPFNPVTGYTGNNMAGPINPETGNLFDLQNPFTPEGPTSAIGGGSGMDMIPDPITSQQPTGGFDSKTFANDLLTGIGDLFKQHFPESAQMAFNNSNQMQSQIEQPIQDATTFDVQPQQNMAFNPFSVNTLGGSFGGGY